MRGGRSLDAPGGSLPTPVVGGSSGSRIDLSWRLAPEEGMAVRATHPPHQTNSGTQA